jgi:hypothetical protein
MYTKLKGGKALIKSLTHGMGMPFHPLECLGDKHVGPHLDQTTKSFQLGIYLIETNKINNS